MPPKQRQLPACSASTAHKPVHPTPEAIRSTDEPEVEERQDEEHPEQLNPADLHHQPEPPPRKSPHRDQLPKDQDDDQISILRDMVKGLAQWAGKQPKPAEPTVDSDNQSTKLRHFLELKPIKFNGRRDPKIAEGWIQEMEKIYEVLPCSEEQKVAMAAYMFEGEARVWWTELKQRKQTQGLDWEHFVALFYNRHFPSYIRERKEIEFLELTQGNSTVAEYASLFNDLIRFAPHYANDEAKKANKFFHALKPSIHDKLAPFRLTSFGDIWETAEIIEECENRERQRTGFYRGQSSGEESFLQPRFTGNKRRYDQGPGQIQINTPRNNSPVCSICGKQHGNRPCYWATRGCFGCGGLGHRVRDCPNRHDQPTQTPIQPPIPRAPFHPASMLFFINYINTLVQKLECRYTPFMIE